MRALSLRIQQVAVLLFALVCSASMWLCWTRITNAVHASRASSSVLQPKVLTDLYPSWYASRELLLHHRDPYGIEVSNELQIAYYGKMLDPARPEERQDQQRFAYPLYFVFFVAPLAWMPFHAAQIIFWWVLAVFAFVNVLIWLRTLRLRLPPLALAALFAMVVGSVPVIQNLSILQPFLLPACLIAATAAAAVSGRLFVGGALLAAATVKPQICVLPVGWFILWTCSDWKHRRSFFLGFVVALAALVVASAWLMPSWLMKYPEVLKSYAEYTKATSFLGARLPSPLRWPVEILALAAVASYCWRARRQAADSAPFAMALAFVLALTVLIIPTVVQPFNHVLLLPAVLLGIAHWQELRRGNLAMRSVALVFAICALLPWLFAVGAVLNPVAVRPDWLLKLWSLPVAASMLLPFAAFGMLILLQKLVPVQPTSPQATLAPLKPVGLAAPKGHA